MAFQRSTVFIKNLDKTVDNKAMYDTFSAYGDILYCEVARDKTGQSKDYGFVEFATTEAANMAIEKANGMLLNDKRVCVEASITRQERESDFGKVFVSNLDTTVDTKGLHDMFSPYGNILSCNVVADETGQSKGCGFVRFETEEEADMAVKEAHGIQNGMFLMVKRSVQCPPQHMVTTKIDKKVFVERSISRQERESDFGKVFVNNLDSTVNKKGLYDMFSPYGNILSSDVVLDVTGRCKGYGFVRFETEEEADTAVKEAHGIRNGTFLSVERSIHCPLQRNVKTNIDNEGFIERSISRQERESDFGKVFVNYLDSTVNNKGLYDMFSPYGNISSCNVVLDKTGQSKGYGFVRFETEEEADMAVKEAHGIQNGTFLMVQRSIHCPLQRKLNTEIDKKGHIERSISRQERESDFGKVFVNNLDSTVNNKGLYDMFSPYGNISSCNVVLDVTGRSKGYGFVRFETEEEADMAVKKAHGIRNGTFLCVERSIHCPLQRKVKQEIDKKGLIERPIHWPTHRNVKKKLNLSEFLSKLMQEDPSLMLEKE